MSALFIGAAVVLGLLGLIWIFSAGLLRGGYPEGMKYLRWWQYALMGVVATALSIVSAVIS